VIPRVVGSPYDYGVPGAVHALMSAEEVRKREAEVAARVASESSTVEA
ncbi:MAG: hypothetical protein JSS97_18700, partial [Actinobacteria bacterium]|nr:hypothetical protein [Actinomycetota bacterium]